MTDRVARFTAIVLRRVSACALLVLTLAGGGCARTVAQLNVDNQLEGLRSGDLTLYVCRCQVADCSECAQGRRVDLSETLVTRGRTLIQVGFDVDPPPRFVRVESCDNAAHIGQGLVFAFGDGPSPSITVALSRVGSPARIVISPPPMVVPTRSDSGLPGC